MIAAISMVRNEADIIEAFVRHTLTFADHLFICDHNSSDNTQKIIKLLIQECLPITLYEYMGTAQTQSEIMSQLMQVAFQKHFSLVIPLDADEFIIPSDEKTDLYTYLHSLSSNKGYFISSIDYKLPNDVPIFALSQNCLRKSNINTKKILLSRQQFIRTGYVISQGNHMLLDENGEEIILPICLQAHIAHFPYRCQNQFISKNVAGWLSNVCKYTTHTYMAVHWGEIFYNLRDKGSITMITQTDFSPAQIPLKYTQSKLRYGNLSSNSYWHNILAVAENIAEVNCELNFLRQEIPISVIILFTGNFDEFKNTFQNIYKNDYPYTEYIILVLPQENKTIIKELYLYLENYANKLSISLLQEDTIDCLFSSLKKYVHGLYIQILLPDINLPSHKLCTVGAALHNINYSFLFCYLDEKAGISLDYISVKCVFTGNGDEFYDWQKKHNISDRYALSMPLFTKEQLAELSYLQPCFYDGNYHSDILWKKLLNTKQIWVSG